MVPVGTWVEWRDDLPIDDRWVYHEGPILVAGYTYFEDTLYYEIVTECGRVSQVHYHDLEEAYDAAREAA